MTEHNWNEWVVSDETKQFSRELYAARMNILESIISCPPDERDKKIGMVIGIGIVIDEINKRREVSNAVG